MGMAVLWIECRTVARVQNSGSSADQWLQIISILIMQPRLGKSISSMLARASQKRRNGNPRVDFFEIERILSSKREPIYSYEILSIYYYLATHEDSTAFKRLDKIIFPEAGREWMLQPSFKIAYTRLYCLIKYFMPYSEWLQLVRELMQEETPTEGDLRFLITFSYFHDIGQDKNIQQFHSEILECLENSINDLDPLTLIALRKYYGKDRINRQQSIQVKHLMEDQIDKYIPHLTMTQLLFVSNTNILGRNWLYIYCLFALNSPSRKYGFFADFLCRNVAWKQWALDNFGRKGVLAMMPGTIQNVTNEKKSINYMLNRLVSVRPYIDQFFQFEEVLEGGNVRIALKNPAKDITLFLQNAYHSLYCNLEPPSLDIITKIKQVLKDHQDIENNFTCLIMHVSVSSAINLLLSPESEAKRQQEAEFIIEAAKWLHELEISGQSLNESHKRIQPYITRLYKQFASFQKETYSLPEFKELFNKMNNMKKRFSGLHSYEPNELQRIIEIYMNHPKPNTNSLLYGELTKMESPGPQVSIMMASQVEVNRCVVVDYMIKIKDTNSGKEETIFVDFIPHQQRNPTHEEQSKITPNCYWKFKYLRKWCSLNFKIIRSDDVQDFIASREYEKLLPTGDNL